MPQKFPKWIVYMQTCTIFARRRKDNWSASLRSSLTGWRLEFCHSTSEAVTVVNYVVIQKTDLLTHTLIIFSLEALKW
jgi:hypothetical protein